MIRHNKNKKLSCRKETVRLLFGLVLTKYNWKTILCGHYRSIFHHFDVIELKFSYRMW